LLISSGGASAGALEVLSASCETENQAVNVAVNETLDLAGLKWSGAVNDVPVEYSLSGRSTAAGPEKAGLKVWRATNHPNLSFHPFLRKAAKRVKFFPLVERGFHPFPFHE